ncbi:hypothetical protein [Anaeromyxobacter oryzae]|uniref:Uncharacterized protein n=1 Tax=Anaeromyxobacter oryzae TaxID=2918170 RepID=A0ABM7X3E7_9BACT|nr:hypothetical protein [Anaeromyxobacter oryzae]BDG06314.1 hypothetical protein AMOR_53100 [Anaeromyxobacter oryzae]
MIRPGIEPQGQKLRWTAEDLCESYDELAELEPLAAGAAEDVTAPEVDDLELVATLEARRDEESAPEGDEMGAEPAPEVAPADAETYVVLPEIDLLSGIVEAVRAEAAPDDTSEEAAPEAEAVVA